MDIKQIRYFIAVAEKGSLSAASDFVHVAQPALSSQISNLEANLGVPLFQRHGRGMALTEAGKTFLKHAYKINDSFAEARNAVASVQSEPCGVVYLGLPMTTANVLTVPIMEQARELYPNIDVRIVDAMSGDVFNWLTEGRLDLAVIYGSENSVPAFATPLVEDDLYLIGLNIPIEADREEVDFRELAHLPLIHSSRLHALRLVLDGTAEKMGFALKYVHVIDSIPQLKELLLRNLGLTVLPRASFLDTASNEKLRYMRVVSPELRLTSWLAYTPRRDASLAAKCIYSILPQTVSSLLDAGKWPHGRLLAGHSRS